MIWNVCVCVCVSAWVCFLIEDLSWFTLESVNPQATSEVEESARLSLASSWKGQTLLYKPVSDFSPHPCYPPHPITLSYPQFFRWLETPDIHLHKQCSTLCPHLPGPFEIAWAPPLDAATFLGARWRSPAPCGVWLILPLWLPKVVTSKYSTCSWKENAWSMCW